jgi:hypothetical protein
MGLIKKVDVKAYLATRRGLRVPAVADASKQIANKRVKIGFSSAKPASARVTSAEFLQDFCLDHSSPDHSSPQRSAQAAFVPLAAGRPRIPQVVTVIRNQPA